MAETAINLTIGGILSGIGYIALSIDEYSLKNEKILELQREINMIAPFIQNMQTSAPQIGIYGRLQKLAVLLQQIKNWIIEIGQMSKFKHFIFAISHTKQISQFYIEIKEIKMELGFEMRVGNFQSQAKLNKQMDDLLESLKKTDDCEKIKLLFDTQRELNEAKLEANRECFQDAVKHLNGLICEQDLRLEELNKRIENVENFQPATLEHQRILLENQKVQLEIIRAKNHALELELMSKEKLCQKITPEMIEYSKIQLEMQKIQMELKSRNSPAKPTCECTFETSDHSADYPYVATFCSQGCLGKKCNVVLENKEYYVQRMTELCESIPPEKQPEYENFTRYIENGNFNAEHIVYLLEYEMEQKREVEHKREMEQKRLADEKDREIATIQLKLLQAREQYNHAYSAYRRHLVQCIGEEKSHGPTS